MPKIAAMPALEPRQRASRQTSAQDATSPSEPMRGPLDDLLVFHELARSLTSTLDLKSILQTTLQFIERFIQADLWALLMLAPSRRDLYYVAADGGEDQRLSKLRVKLGQGLAGWVAQHGETLIIPDAGSDPRLDLSGTGGSLAIRSAIGLPIRGRKGTHGVLEIFNPRLDENSDYNTAFLHLLADYAAIAIENAQEVERAQRLTITDDVTGLYNARHLYAELERELDLARRESRPLSLVFLDLDRFKSVNDRYGHLAGSDLLGQVARRIQDLCRDTDVCFRYGGDEFVILMPETSREEALRMTRSIHAFLAAEPFDLGNHLGKDLKIHIGASAGIATYPGDGRTVHAILGAADKRMYAIKSSGRGRVQA